jgi:hypothetical protein
MTKTSQFSRRLMKTAALGALALATLGGATAAQAADAAAKAAEKAKREPKYSLTDLTKVWDRAIKLEAIRQRMAGDEEGSFYDPQNRGQTDENERPD